MPVDAGVWLAGAECADVRKEIPGNDAFLGLSQVRRQRGWGAARRKASRLLCGQLAAAGYRVLAVDLDVSGNLALDLGYANDPRHDQAKSLVRAVWDDEALQVIADVRPNLDVLPGGRHLELLR